MIKFTRNQVVIKILLPAKVTRLAFECLPASAQAIHWKSSELGAEEFGRQFVHWRLKLALGQRWWPFAAWEVEGLAAYRQLSAL